MTRRPSRGLQNPVLVGAVTVLVVIIAVFLSYNANRGLPFVPTRELSVTFPNGQNLVPGYEVREGGLRIGVIDRIEPATLPGGGAGARVVTKLDGKAGELPVDSVVAVRPRSSLSLEYLEVVRGTSEETIEDGGTLPVEQARGVVKLDQVLDMFDRPTREAAADALIGFGNGLASRGADLNRAIEELPPVFRALRPVAETLAAPETNLRRFFRELADAARIVSPVAEEYAQSFGDGATTFEAFGRDPDALRETISRNPPTLDEGIRSFRVQRPLLTDLAGLSRDLEVATERLDPALAPLTAAIVQGQDTNRRSPALFRRTGETLVALRDLAAAPSTNLALERLTGTTGMLNPIVRFLGPRFTVCNRWTMFWTFTSEHFTETDATGNAQRALANSSDQQDNSVSSMGAVVPANGEGVSPGGIPEYRHGQPFGAAVDEQGNADCEDGQRGYPDRLASKAEPRFFGAMDPNTPGNQGPLYDRFENGKGVGLTPSRVPEGQTFTSQVETGAKLP